MKKFDGIESGPEDALDAKDLKCPCTTCALKVVKEAYVRGICEWVEHHLWSGDSHPAYRGICALRSSKPIPWCTAVRAEGGGRLAEELELKARWAGDFERLHQADPPAVEVDARGVTIPIADPPMNCDPPSIVKTGCGESVEMG